MPVLTGSVHAHILTKPSRAGFAVIRLGLIEPGAETCVYQAKACSPTDQPVRNFKDGLGINITMKTFFTLHNISCEKHSMVVYTLRYIYEPYPWAQSVVDCDASVMVGDCAAVKTGCILEKYIHTC